MATLLKWFGTQLDGMIQAGVKDIVKSGCYDIESDAKRNATRYVKTGRERSSISTNWSESGTEHGIIKSPSKDTEVTDGVKKPKSIPGIFTGVVGTNVVYARRLELGFVGQDKLGRTINQKPRPHIIPAFEKHKKIILGKIKGMLK